MKDKAFTLAEVLITIGIIGVVAAVTLPVLIQKLDDNKNISSLKKAYSVLLQATNLAVGEYGNPSGWGLRNDNIISTRRLFVYYDEHIRSLKKCGTNTECWGLPTMALNGVQNILTDSSYWVPYSSFSVFNDGTSMYVDVDNDLARIYLDVNGKKKPNRLGRDVFCFMLNEDGLNPCGYKSTITDCNRLSRGEECASQIMRDSWKIKY